MTQHIVSEDLRPSLAHGENLVGVGRVDVLVVVITGKEGGVEEKLLRVTDNTPDDGNYFSAFIFDLVMLPGVLCQKESPGAISSVKRAPFLEAKTHW